MICSFQGQPKCQRKRSSRFLQPVAVIGRLVEYVGAFKRDAVPVFMPAAGYVRIDYVLCRYSGFGFLVSVCLPRQEKPVDVIITRIYSQTAS